MPRGGKRKGAGGKFKWNHGKTTVVRIPESLADEIMNIARALDQGALITLHEQSSELCYDDVTQSKVIDLSGVSVKSFLNQPAVLIADLLVKGYDIEPKNITESSSVKKALENHRRLSEIQSMARGVT